MHGTGARRAYVALVVLVLFVVGLAAVVEAARMRGGDAQPSPAATGTVGMGTLAPASSAAPSPTAATFTNPWDYCAAVDTVDRPDTRYTGPAVPPAIYDALAVAERLPARFADPAARRVPLPWRCMDAAVWACDPGANLNCGAANTSRQPTTAMLDWCAKNPDGVLPAYVSGHETIYAWSCRGGRPVIDRQPFQTDPRGFVANFWYRLDRPR